MAEFRRSENIAETPQQNTSENSSELQNNRFSETEHNDGEYSKHDDVNSERDFDRSKTLDFENNEADHEPERDSTFQAEKGNDEPLPVENDDWNDRLHQIENNSANEHEPLKIDDNVEGNRSNDVESTNKRRDTPLSIEENNQDARTFERPQKEEEKPLSIEENNQDARTFERPQKEEEKPLSIEENNQDARTFERPQKEEEKPLSIEESDWDSRTRTAERTSETTEKPHSFEDDTQDTPNTSVKRAEGKEVSPTLEDTNLENVDSKSKTDKQEKSALDNTDTVSKQEQRKEATVENTDEKKSPQSLDQKTTPEQNQIAKQRMLDDMEMRKSHPSGFKNLENGTLAHSTEKAKFTGKTYDALGKSMGENAYKKTYDEKIREGKSKEEARKEAEQAKRNMEKYIAEKKDSSAKYCDEDRFLNHANAKGEQAKEKARSEGKSDRACERAYNKAFRDTYIKDYGKRAYEAELRNSGDKEAAKKAQEKAEHIATLRTEGNRINRIKPGSFYYKTYENTRKGDTMLAGHGEAFNKKPIYVYSTNGFDSKDGPSANYSTYTKQASPRNAIQGNALPAMNTAKKEDRILFNDKRADGSDVYVMESKSAPKLADQDIGKFATKENNEAGSKEYDVPVFYGKDRKEKLVGGDNQLVTAGNGRWDGSVRKVEATDSPEKIELKENYLQDLSKRCGDEGNLKKIDTSSQWIRVEGQELETARKSFDRDKDALIKEWEAQNGKEWPTYKEDIYNDAGKIVRHAGDKYDAHHIQPLSLGGRNLPENLVPLHYQDHIGEGGIHNTESYNKLFDAYDSQNNLEGDEKE